MHVPVILALTILTRGALSLPLLILIVVPVSIALADIFDRLVTAPSANLGHRLTRTRAKRASRRNRFFGRDGYDPRYSPLRCCIQNVRLG